MEVAHTEHELDVLALSRAGRLDVYVTYVEGNRYDVEIQAESRGDELLWARHYQALMDSSQLKKGMPVRELRRCAVVFVCDFDPLEKGFRVYECKTSCRQTCEEVDGDSFVDEIRSEIRRLVQDPEWLEGFMTFEEALEVARYNAEKRGYDKGVSQGFDEGIDMLAEALAGLGMDASLVAEGVERVRKEHGVERKQ